MCAIHGYVSSLYTRAETNSQVAEYSIVYALAETDINSQMRLPKKTIYMNAAENNRPISLYGTLEITQLKI
jgi:hypothetical protein